MEKTKYVLVNKSGATKFFLESKNVSKIIDKYLLSQTGIFYLISIYPALVTVEEFQVIEENGKRKIFRTNAKNF